MNVRRIAISVALAWLVCLPAQGAFGVWMVAEVSPHDAEAAGFQVTTEEGGADPRTTTLIISRKLGKEDVADVDPDKKPYRRAELKLTGDSGLIVECQLEPRREGEFLKYRVTLAKNLLAQAGLRFWETSPPTPVESSGIVIYRPDGSKMSGKERDEEIKKSRIGWHRVIYELKLGEFVAK
jgi:hypothetical protein